MEPKERFKKLLDKYRKDPEYILEGIILRVSEKIAGIMEDRHMARGQLAEKLGCSPAYVTKLLRGSENLTLRKLFEVSNALDAELGITLSSRAAGSSSQDLESRYSTRDFMVVVFRVGGERDAVANAA